MSEYFRERGAAAVEFALVLPLLLALVLGMAAFSRGYQIQSSLSMAAREGAREMAINNSPGAANTLAVGKAQALIGANGVTAVTTPAACSPGSSVTTTVSYNFDLFGFGGFLGTPEAITLNGKGVMRCGG